MCSDNSFPGSRGSKYSHVECMFLSAALCRSWYVCDFSQQATLQLLTFPSLSFLCPPWRLLQRKSRNVVFKRRERPAFVCDWDSQRLLQFKSDFWLTGSCGSLKLTVCSERGQMGWRKLRRWSATHDFPSDSSVSQQRWTERLWTVSELISQRLLLHAGAPSSWRLHYG